jgi:hypothetical protein
MSADDVELSIEFCKPVVQIYSFADIFQQQTPIQFTVLSMTQSLFIWIGSPEQLHFQNISIGLMPRDPQVGVNCSKMSDCQGAYDFFK